MKTDDGYVEAAINDKIEIDPKKAEKTLIMTPAVFAKVFSPQRMHLILKVSKNNIQNIYQIAKDLNRKYAAVHRDISYLKSIGILKLRKKNKKVIPYIAENIMMPKIPA